jgi:hypothetical protein
LAHLTHINNNLAAVSQIVSGLFKKFLISNWYLIVKISTLIMDHNFVINKIYI